MSISSHGRPMLVFAALMAGLLLCLVSSGSAAPVAPWEIDALRGRPAPAFSLVSLPDGEVRKIADYAGTVVLVNFWATWCGPCRHEMPLLNRLHRRYRDKGFTVLGIALDDDARIVRAFVRRLGVQFPILHDPTQRTAKAYKVFAYPTSFLIDRAGIVRAIYLGEQDWNGPAITAAVESLLTSPADTPPAKTQREEKP